MAMNRLGALGLSLAMTLASVAIASPDLQLNAILGKKVIVTLNGKQLTLKEGQQVEAELTLLEVSSKQAVFNWQGNRLTLSPDSRISTQFEERKAESITIYRDASSHYIVTGEINGRSTQMVVDTGATIVAINAAQASQMGLDWQNNPSGTIATVGGATRAYAVKLEKITVGGIAVYHVDAVVVPNQATPFLLGMSFLRHFEMNESDNVLTLKKKF